MRTKTFLVFALVLGLACTRPPALRRFSFTEIQRQVDGMTPSEVAKLLGDPDFREPILDDEQRWVWWNRTVLEGSQYAPEVRGRVVHLEITFQLQRPAPPAEDWRVVGPLAVTYTLPASREERRFQGALGSP